jgi:uncharacterized protein (DUF1778 family)
MEIQCFHNGPRVAAKRGRYRVERKDESIRLRLTADEKRSWTRAAHDAGRDLSNWLRFIANREAGRGK